MDITGTIIAALTPAMGRSQRTGNPWMKQEYVIEVPGMYPRRCCFSLFGEDRIKQFALQVGEQNVTVQFDIDAHEHEGRWYNEVRAWNVIRAGQQQPAFGGSAWGQQGAQASGPSGAQMPMQGAAPFPPAPAPGAPGTETEDDLPF